MIGLEFVKPIDNDVSTDGERHLHDSDIKSDDNE